MWVLERGRVYPYWYVVHSLPLVELYILCKYNGVSIVPHTLYERVVKVLYYCSYSVCTKAIETPSMKC